MHLATRLASLVAVASITALTGCSSSTTDASTTATSTGTTTTTTATTTATGQGGAGHGGAGHGGMAHGGAGQGGAAQGVDCDTYCGHVMTNCTDALQQFPDEATCKAYCATWEPGDADKHTGDTVACHDYHADAPASGSPDPHCFHGGPSGDGQCGASTCDNFCAAAVKLCTGPNQVWADEAACKADCAGFTSSGQGYSTAATAGDTVECRLYHLTVAATDPVAHCPHIGADSPVCQ